MSVYPIADYFTTFPTTAEQVVAGESLFNVPASSYLTNAKGQYCLVSLADGAFFKATEDQPFVVILADAMNNGGDAVLGNFATVAEHGNGNYQHTFVPNNSVKYLIPSRPQQLRIKFKTADGTAVSFATGEGYLTFKFEYLSKEAVKMMNDESDTTTF
jgi:hypothetical protein